MWPQQKQNKWMRNTRLLNTLLFRTICFKPLFLSHMSLNIIIMHIIIYSSIKVVVSDKFSGDYFRVLRETCVHENPENHIQSELT